MAENNQPNRSDVYLVYGEDAFRVDAEVEQLMARLVPQEDRNIALEMFDGRSENVAAALDVLYKCREAVLTPGFMISRKTVFLRQASFLRANQLGRSKEVGVAVQALADAIMAGLPPGVALVVSAQAVDAQSPLLAAFKAAGGRVRVHAAAKPWELDRDARAYLQEAFEQQGAFAEQEALEAFVQRVGADLRVYGQEIEKLLLFIAPRKHVTEQDVLDIASPNRESCMSDFMDAVAMRNLNAALADWRRLAFQKIDPIRLVTGLNGRFRTLALLGELMQSGVLQKTGRAVAWRDPDGSIAARLEAGCGDAEGGDKANPMKMNAYRVGILATQARQFGRHELSEVLKRLTEAREGLVSSRRPETLMMDFLLLRICGKPRR